MPKKRLDVSLMAQADVKRITAFYSKTAGEAVSVNALKVFEDAFNRLTLGIVTHRQGKRCTRECVLRKFPYIVIYRATAHSVHIVRVLHQARDYFNA